jgi:hypothetical protein
MAISAEQLNIILAAKDKEFAKAMAANSKRVENFAKKADKDLSGAGASFERLAQAAKGLAAAAVFQQLASSVRAAADKLGDLADAANSIGLTTTALQELRYAAQLSGVQQDVLQQSLVVLSKNLGDAAMGGSAAKKSLEGLNLSAAQLSAVPLEEALGMIADRIAAVENPMQRATLAADLFGKSGVKMINMLSQGSDGLARMREEAQAMGVVIDESVIKKAEDAGDQLDAMSMVISSNLTVALITIAPLLISAAQAIAGLSSAAREFLTISAGGGMPNLLDADELAAAAVEYSKVKKETDNLIEAQNKLNALELQAEMGKPPTIPQLDDAHERVEIAKQELEAAKAAVVQREKADAQRVAGFNAFQAETDELQDQVDLQGLSNEERAKAVALKEKEAFLANQIALANAADPSGTASPEILAGISALAEEHYNLAVQAELSKAAQNGSNGAMSESKKKALEAKQSLEAYKAQVEALGLTLSEFESISSTIQSSMEDAFMGIVDGTMSAKDAFRSMAADIIKELYRVLVVQQLVGSIGGGGILGAIGGALGITGSASGGALMAGQPSVVGEHGRELFVPSSAGRVLSVPQAKAAVNGGNSVSVTQNISFGAGVSRAEIQAMLPKIVESTKAAVFDAQRRSVNGMGY